MPARASARYSFHTVRDSGPGLTRRAALLMPLLLAACGGEEPQYFPPLHYNYLPPIQLNVAKIDIEQHFMPSGMPPDVTQFDPVTPSDALRAMANERLKAFGSVGRAVFVIQDASLVKRDDTITGTLDVVLNVYPSDNGPRAGFAEAHVTRTYQGDTDNLRARLYDMTKSMMQAMNVEFEYQVQNRLHDWLVSGAAAVPAVQQQPLVAAPSPSVPPPGTPAPPPPTALTPPPAAAPPAAPPQSMPPPVPMPPPGNP